MCLEVIHIVVHGVDICRIHLSIFYSKYICDEKWKTLPIWILLNKYASDADKLTHLGSSQANESLDNDGASKALKSNFYSGAESSDYRFAAAIAQKNIGYGYVTDVSIYWKSY